MLETNEVEKIRRPRVHQLIDGSGIGRQGKLLGYCWCNLHPGYLTKHLLDKHECLKKNCVFLEKFKDHPYWIQREKAKQSRLDAKQMQAEIKQREEQILTRFRELTNHMDYFAAASCELENHVFVLRCVSLEAAYIASYVKAVSEEFKVQIEVRFIKNSYEIRKLLIDKIKNENI